MESARILLVEDDEYIAKLVSKYLERSGFTTTVVHDGLSALDYFKNYEFDIVVLDLNLPFMDGLKVAKKMKAIKQTPILMLTARTTELDELHGFKAGADDYVKKPFNPEILILRIKRLLARSANSNPAQEKSNELTIGKLHLDKKQRSLKIGENNYSLSQKQLYILEKLMEAKGSAVTRKELLDTMRSKSNDIRVVDATIKNMRKILPEDLIKSVRGVGYKLNSKYITS